MYSRQLSLKTVIRVLIMMDKLKCRMDKLKCRIIKKGTFIATNIKMSISTSQKGEDKSICTHG